VPDIVVPEEIKPPLLPAGGNNATNSPPVIVETPIDTTVEDTFSTPSPTTNSGNDYSLPLTLTQEQETTLILTTTTKKHRAPLPIMRTLIAEVMPEFPGGIQAMHRFIQDNLKVQEGTDVERTRIVVSFVVGPDGNISDIKSCI
jgi:protein TonB